MTFSFQSTGLAGWLVVLSVPTLLTAAGVMFAKRVRRTAALALMFACLWPLGIGLAGVLASRIDMFSAIEALADPTDRDLAAYRAGADTNLVLGVGAMMICNAAALVVLARARPDETAAA